MPVVMILAVILIWAAILTLTIMVIVLPCTVTWTAAGTVLNRFFAGDRSRYLGIGLGVLLAATVVFIWL